MQRRNRGIHSSLLLICVGSAFGFFLPYAPAYAQTDNTLWLQGRFVELAAKAELRIRNAANPGIQELVPLCFAYYRLKRYDGLGACIDRLEARTKVGDRKYCVEGCFGFTDDVLPLPDTLRSGMALDFGDYEKAAMHAERALAQARQIPSGGVMLQQAHIALEVLPTIALAAVRRGDRERARRALKEIDEVTFGFIASAMLGRLKTIAQARAHISLGEHKEALALLHTAEQGIAVAITDLIMSSGGETIATTTEPARLLMMAKCLIELARFDEAKLALDSFLAFKRASEQSDLYWIALYERGRLAEKDEPDKAIQLYRHTIDIIEAQRASISTEAGKIGFVGDKQAAYERLVFVLVGKNQVAEAFDYVERSKARALVDMLASKKDFAAHDPERARLVLAQLDAADLASRAERPNVRREDAPSTRSLEVARQEIRQAAPELSTLVTVTSVPPAELRSLVGPDEVLVEYYYHGNDLYAFLLDRERLAVFRMDAGGLSDGVQKFRNAAQEPLTSAWQEHARAAYRRLWQPIRPSIKASKVIIVAHGVLHYLPFAALQDETGKFLVDQYSLRLLPSSSVLKFLGPSFLGKQGPLLVLGNPDLGDSAMDLKFAEDEARIVAKLSSDSRVLLRRDASESNFKKVGAMFSRIHFASHGKFQASEPLSSGLYLAKDAENDGVLTVGELYSIKLDVDLVTLSACETGLGKVANGDDVVGLTRGFLYAGSRSIVASLWSVDDKATAELMQAFYENLARHSKQEALRQAQLKTRQSYTHPFFWAAFQLTGRAD